MEVFEKLRTILAENSGVDAEKITPDTLLTDINVDGITFMSLGVVLEDEFNIDFLDLDTLQDCETVADLVAAIEEELAE